MGKGERIIIADITKEIQIGEGRETEREEQNGDETKDPVGTEGQDFAQRKQEAQPNGRERAGPSKQKKASLILFACKLREKGENGKGQNKQRDKKPKVLVGQIRLRN